MKYTLINFVLNITVLTKKETTKGVRTLEDIPMAKVEEQIIPVKAGAIDNIEVMNPQAHALLAIMIPQSKTKVKSGFSQLAV